MDRFPAEKVTPHDSPAFLSSGLNNAKSVAPFSDFHFANEAACRSKYTAFAAGRVWDFRYLLSGSS